MRPSATSEVPSTTHRCPGGGSAGRVRSQEKSWGMTGTPTRRVRASSCAGTGSPVKAATRPWWASARSRCPASAEKPRLTAPGLALARSSGCFHGPHSRPSRWRVASPSSSRTIRSGARLSSMRPCARPEKASPSAQVAPGRPIRSVKVRVVFGGNPNLTASRAVACNASDPGRTRTSTGPRRPACRASRADRSWSGDSAQARSVMRIQSVGSHRGLPTWHSGVNGRPTEAVSTV